MKLSYSTYQFLFKCLPKTRIIIILSGPNCHKTFQVCGHRWKNARYYQQNLLYMQGLCYERDATSNFRLVPLLVDNDPSNLIHTIELYPVLAYGSMGQSVQYTKVRVDGIFYCLNVYVVVFFGCWCFWCCFSLLFYLLLLLLLLLFFVCVVNFVMFVVVLWLLLLVLLLFLYGCYTETTVAKVQALKSVN